MTCAERPDYTGKLSGAGQQSCGTRPSHPGKHSSPGYQLCAREQPCAE